MEEAVHHITIFRHPLSTSGKGKKKKKFIDAIPRPPREYLSAALSETLDDLTDLPAC